MVVAVCHRPSKYPVLLSPSLFHRDQFPNVRLARASWAVYDRVSTGLGPCTSCQRAYRLSSFASGTGMGRIYLSVIFLFASISLALATCGERGGPGYRGPNGKCVSWKTIASVCGHPPETRCTPEQEADGAKEAAAAQHRARQTRRPEDRTAAERATTRGLMGSGSIAGSEATE